MDIHKNACLTPRGRAELVRRVLELGQAPCAVAADLGVSCKTVRKWVMRFQAEGPGGLDERDEANGTGSAKLLEDAMLEIEFAYHLGDEAVLKAQPVPFSAAC